MYQIQDVATLQYHCNIGGRPIQWETLGEATKFAQLNYPEQLAAGEVAVLRVCTDSPDYASKVVCIRAILGTMTVADRVGVVQELFESLNQQPDT